jgi:hypothetical protein
VVAQAMKGTVKRTVPFGVAAAAMVLLIAALAVGGRWPGRTILQTWKPNGILALDPAAVTLVELRNGGGTTMFRRERGSWQGVPAISGHVEAGLRFLVVTAPQRVLPATTDPAAFGLDPPRTTLVLAGAQGELGRVAFGMMNPVDTSQYVQVAGRRDVILLPRHVGAEWDLAADRARRVAADGAALLLPVSMARIWAVEIVAGGTVTRFERDADGRWLHHVGGHVHVAAADAHIADPAHAREIAAEIDALDRARILRVVALQAADAALAGYGLARPGRIAMFYARDNAFAQARLELGSEQGMLRYARLRDEPAVLAIDPADAARLDELLRIAGRTPP